MTFIFNCFTLFNLLVIVFSAGCKTDHITTPAPPNQGTKILQQKQVTHNEYEFISKTPKAGGSTSLQCVSEKVCWIVGRDKIFITRDGGYTWNDATLPNLSGGPLKGIQFKNAGPSIFWCSDGYYLSSDGSERWHQGRTTPINFPNGQLEVVLLDKNGNIEWAAGGLYRELRKGEGIQGPSRWYARDRNSILETALYHSKNNGANWDRVTFPKRFGVINSLRFYDSKNGIAITQQSIYHTNDSGNNWNQIGASKNCAQQHIFNDEIDDYPVTSFSIEARDIWVAYSSGSIIQSIDGGATWCLILTPGSLKFDSHSRRYFIDLHFINPLKGWGIGGDNYLYKTIDGGKKWSRIESDLVVYSVVYFSEYGLVLTEEGLFTIKTT